MLSYSASWQVGNKLHSTLPYCWPHQICPWVWLWTSHVSIHENQSQHFGRHCQGSFGWWVQIHPVPEWWGYQGKMRGRWRDAASCIVSTLQVWGIRALIWGCCSWSGRFTNIMGPKVEVRLATIPDCEKVVHIIFRPEPHWQSLGCAGQALLSCLTFPSSIEDEKCCSTLSTCEFSG